MMKAGKLPAFTLLHSLLRSFGQANMHGTERQLVAVLDAQFPQQTPDIAFLSCSHR